MRIPKIVFVCTLFVFVTLSQSAEWQVEKSDVNVVKFISDAPIEEFEGITSAIDGYLYWEGDNLLDKSELYFEVDLNSIDTGIGLRNRHMRENYLETETYPTTHFKGAIIKADKQEDGTYKVLVQGKLFIHGVERMKSIKGLIALNGTTMQITSDFDVKLSDYRIPIPSIMFYKINETMALKVTFRLKQIKP